jgi:hypothetical protein
MPLDAVCLCGHPALMSGLCWWLQQRSRGATHAFARVPSWPPRRLLLAGMARQSAQSVFTLGADTCNGANPECVNTRFARHRDGRAPCQGDARPANEMQAGTGDEERARNPGWHAPDRCGTYCFTLRASWLLATTPQQMRQPGKHLSRACLQQPQPLPRKSWRCPLETAVGGPLRCCANQTPWALHLSPP